MWSGIRETCRITRHGTVCTIQGTLDVTNVGDASAGRCNVTFFLSSSPALTPGATELRTQPIPPLRPGAYARANVRATLPTGLRAAGRYLIGFVDSGNLVTEVRESNNTIVFGPIY